MKICSAGAKSSHSHVEVRKAETEIPIWEIGAFWERVDSDSACALMPEEGSRGAKGAEVFGFSVDHYGPGGTENGAEVQDEGDGVARAAGFDDYCCFVACADVNGISGVDEDIWGP
jgi:hypothetical protein